MPRHWLAKSEPGTYSIEDLERDGTTTWEGVRNYQARNLMRDEVEIGDLVLFYHSSAKPTGVAGVGKVVRDAYPDSTCYDPDSPYYDPKSTKDAPRWVMVDVAFVERFEAVVSLATMKADPELEGMPVLAKGQRLSVMPVTKAHFDHVVKLGRGQGA